MAVVVGGDHPPAQGVAHRGREPLGVGPRSPVERGQLPALGARQVAGRVGVPAPARHDQDPIGAARLLGSVHDEPAQHLPEDLGGWIPRVHRRRIGPSRNRCPAPWHGMRRCGWNRPARSHPRACPPPSGAGPEGPRPQLVHPAYCVPSPAPRCRWSREAGGRESAASCLLPRRRRGSPRSPARPRGPGAALGNETHGEHAGGSVPAGTRFSLADAGGALGTPKWLQSGGGEDRNARTARASTTGHLPGSNAQTNRRILLYACSPVC